MLAINLQLLEIQFQVHCDVTSDMFITIVRHTLHEPIRLKIKRNVRVNASLQCKMQCLENWPPGGSKYTFELKLEPQSLP